MRAQFILNFFKLFLSSPEQFLKDPNSYITPLRHNHHTQYDGVICLGKRIFEGPIYLILSVKNLFAIKIHMILKKKVLPIPYQSNACR